MNAGNESDQRDAEPYQDDFRDEVLRGLAQRPKRIAPKFFYDEVGCQLFEEICQLDEYYLTRTEIDILRENATEICRALGPECLLVEFGSGSNVKTRILLDHLLAPAAYVPVDIARTTLRCRRSRRDCNGSLHFSLVPPLAISSRLRPKIFFAGQRCSAVPAVDSLLA
jgi:uncharacterized SAM-dependent methyltransferase